MVLGYFGCLGRGRPVRALLEAVERVIRRYPPAASHLRLRLLGNIHGNQQDVLARFAFQEVIEIAGVRPRRESLSDMLDADALLLFGMGLKTWEYLLSGKPIIGFIGEDDELRSILSEFGHYAVPDSDVSGLAELLERLYLSWVADGRVPGAVTQSPYTTAAAAHALLSIADEAATNKRRSSVRPTASR